MPGTFARSSSASSRRGAAGRLDLDGRHLIVGGGAPSSAAPSPAPSRAAAARAACARAPSARGGGGDARPPSDDDDAAAAVAAAPRVLELGDGARVLVGAPEALLDRAEADGAGATRTLRTFSGYAQWSHAQLLGEVARGDWGVMRSCLADVTARAGAAAAPIEAAALAGSAAVEARAPAPDVEGAPPPPSLAPDEIDDLWGRALASGQVTFPMSTENPAVMRPPVDDTGAPAQ